MVGSECPLANVEYSPRESLGIREAAHAQRDRCLKVEREAEIRVTWAEHALFDLECAVEQLPRPCKFCGLAERLGEVGQTARNNRVVRCEVAFTDRQRPLQ